MKYRIYGNILGNLLLKYELCENDGEKSYNIYYSAISPCEIF